jgi:hypothetical protein
MEVRKCRVELVVRSRTQNSFHTRFGVRQECFIIWTAAGRSIVNDDSVEIHILLPKSGRFMREIVVT